MKSEVPIFQDDRHTVLVPLDLIVDEYGEEWLSAEQSFEMDRLRAAYMRHLSPDASVEERDTVADWIRSGKIHIREREAERAGKSSRAA